MVQVTHLLRCLAAAYIPAEIPRNFEGSSSALLLRFLSPPVGINRLPGNLSTFSA